MFETVMLSLKANDETFHKQVLLCTLKHCSCTPKTVFMYPERNMFIKERGANDDTFHKQVLLCSPKHFSCTPKTVFMYP
jgi:hypothetical protein